MDIATRMKSYEDDARLPKGAVIIRVDGRGFHRWTKLIGAKKPFDNAVHSSMAIAAKQTALNMQGFKLAYVQSDEATFLLTNLGEKEGAWFDYKAQKIASVAASLFTTSFNNEFETRCLMEGYRKYLANFDARAFSIPVGDAANNFVWRQQDWFRNSVQMLGHYHMSHREMQGLKSARVRTLLKNNFDVDWWHLEDWKKFGTFIKPEGPDGVFTWSTPMSYDDINQVTGLDQYLEI